ncbi:hypothetical protein GCM10029992_33550 [Glycomyces albus]
MPGVRQQRQRAGYQCEHQLDDEERADQREGEPQPPGVAGSGVADAVVVCVSHELPIQQIKYNIAIRAYILVEAKCPRTVCQVSGADASAPVAMMRPEVGIRR